MNEMDLLRAHHDAQPSPEPQVVSDARRRLMEEARPRRRMFLRLSRPALAGMGLTAVTAAAAAVAVAGIGIGSSPSSGPPADSGRQILLSAAHQAELAPTAGTYWHVKQDTTLTVGNTTRRRIMENWSTRKGQSFVGYRALAGPDAGESDLLKARGPFTFTICDKAMSFAQVQALPGDPATLKAAIVKAMRSNDDGPVPPGAEQGFTARCLSSLLIDVPATPRTRAAAYRALAGMPNVKVTGKATDPHGRAGVGVTIAAKRDAPPRTRLVIDPRTSLVLSTRTADRSGATGRPDTPSPGKAQVKSATTVYLEVGWTDRKPHVPAS
ncbi:CU044_5270 family protein [Actinomadura sp. B10D3]|uniref:CU044_5270 family protein n=1 Tax=Actinomadura sp. B10D3 TaxID=3153557 RepID=UPI00325F482E